MFTGHSSSSSRRSEQDASKLKSSPSPFRRRRRSNSAAGSRSRSSSPTDSKDGTHVSGLLDRCLSVLHSMIFEDCRFLISRPRPGFPPNALQAFCLDVAQILAHLYGHSPSILSQIAFSVLPAFSTFHPHMLPRVMQFFEDSLLRSMLSTAANYQQIRGLLGPNGGLLDIYLGLFPHAYIRFAILRRRLGGTYRCDSGRRSTG